MSNGYQEIERRLSGRFMGIMDRSVGRAMREASADPRHDNERTPVDGSVTYPKIPAGNIVAGHLAFNSVTAGAIGAGVVGNSEINGSMKNGGQNSATMRSIGGSGSSLAAASANHIHSIPFKALPTQERRRLIALADELDGHEFKDPKIDALKELMLGLFSMAADDQEMDRHERERLVDEDPEFEHGMRMDHDPEYHARHMLLHDSRYRRFVPDGNERIREIARSMEELEEDEGRFVLAGGRP